MAKVREISQYKINIFSQAIIDGKSNSDAYRLAYPGTKSKNKTIHVRACEMMKDSKVKVRIAELREEQNKEFKISIAEKKRALWELVEYGTQSTVLGIENPIEKQRNPSAAVAAIKELNLMEGDHAAQKIEHSGKVDLASALESARKRVK